MPFCF